MRRLGNYALISGAALMGCSSAPLCEIDPEHQGCQSQTDGDGDATGDGDGDSTGDGDGDGDGDATGDGDNTCTQLGCDCDGTPESCDNTLMCIDGTCGLLSCGNGALDVNEECDDGNPIGGDGCDNDCTDTKILQVVAGGHHTCALIEGGRVRCWGLGFLGQLGNGDATMLGDDETLEGLPASDVGGTPSQFSLGATHSCARFPDDSVRCWGNNINGQLGIGNTMNIGDDEAPASIGPVIISPTIAVAAGGGHTCAMSTDFELTCWGSNTHGQLGYGNTILFGDDPGEVPQAAGSIDLEPPNLPNGATLIEVSLGAAHSCALFTSGDALCWGANDHGQLGQGNVEDWGNDNSETPAMLEPINLGGAATAISAGSSHTCALLEGGDVRCWGYNGVGQLGIGQPGVNAVGDNELPSAVSTVSLGAPAVAISSGYSHNCALLDTNEIICWGENSDGRLGYGHTNRIGDDETPESAGSVELF